MSYLTYALLTEDVNFGRRARACINQQANALSDQSGSAVDLLAIDLLKGEPQQMVLMINAICAGPNFDTIVDVGDGTIDSSRISDQQILDHTKAMLAEVARIFYPGPPPEVTPPPSPTATSVQPTSGPQGTLLTINGVSLTKTTKVTVGGFACTNLGVVSDTQVTCTTPSGPNKGSRPIEMTVDNTTFATGLNFQVT